ncbi:universal stress protein [Rufibacter soli]
MKIFLVPTDFSLHAKKALLFALDLAHRSNARLLVTHVYPSPKAMVGSSGTTSEEVRQQALQRMQAFLEDVPINEHLTVPLDFILKEGHIIHRLCLLIEQNNVALVVMGTQGAHSQMKKFLGTNTESLAKRGLCPVLAVPEQASLEPVKHIVYSSSLEHDESLAMYQLLQVKNAFKAQLTILHVNSEDQLDLVDDTEIKTQLRVEFPEEDFRFDTIDEEDVATGIMAYVKTHPTDLLAFTMLHHDFWDRIFLDSVTVKLLQSLHLPMLVIPENGKKLDLLQKVAHENLAEARKAPSTL